MKKKEDKNKSEDKSNEKLIESFLNRLLQLIGTKAKANASVDKDKESIEVNIEGGEETGLLIGNRGKTLQSIQVLSGLMFRQKTGNWIRVLINIGDWRQKEESRLEDLAWQTAQRVRETGKKQILYNLNSSQRRIIHLTLADEKDIETSSEGEGKERYLIVSPKK